MNSRWSNDEQLGTSNVFEALHFGLTVQLIATARRDLRTCQPGEAIADVITRIQESYDFLPVIDEASGEVEHILGLFRAVPFFGTSTLDGCVKDHFRPLTEEYLIGADASILAFVMDADTKPCRLVVSGPEIVGLVSLSDLQKLPVRAALFALITGLEITMFEAIKEKFQGSENWMKHLSDGRKNKIAKEIKASRRDDGYVDSLLFTKFADKAKLILMSCDLNQSKRQLRTRFKDIQNLRDNVAHANEYAATPEHARSVCSIVRDLLELQKQIASTYVSRPLHEQSEARRRWTA